MIVYIGPTSLIKANFESTCTKNQLMASFYSQRWLTYTENLAERETGGNNDTIKQTIMLGKDEIIL